MARRCVLPLLAFLLVLLVGCTRGGDAFPPPTTPNPSELIFATFTPDASRGSSSGTATMSGEELVAFIENHLVDGSPEELIDTLESQGYGFEPGSVVREDLNGDGEREWVMVIIPTPEAGDHNEGLFAILESLPPDHEWIEGAPARESSGTYHLAYDWTFSSWQNTRYEILTVRDVTGDEQDDVLFELSACWTAPCNAELSLVSYHGASEPRELLNMDPLSGSMPRARISHTGRAEFRFRDWDGDGTKELLVHTNYPREAQGGPQRGLIEIFHASAPSGDMIWTEGAWLPTDSRYFRLRDGDLLIAREMYREAIGVLEEVVYSDTLLDSELDGTEGEPSDTNGDVRRFAYLRLMQAALLRGDRPLAARYHGEMAAEWPTHQLVELAYDMLYANPRDFWSACAATSTAASSISDLTGSLGRMEMDVLSITSKQFCPQRLGGDVPMPLLLPHIDYDPDILP